MTEISFQVIGLPIAQGSKRHVGAGRMIESSPLLAPWRSTVASSAAGAGRGHKFFEPVFVEATFLFPRPKSHYGTGANAAIIKPGAPTWHSKTPDLDKLLRALLDGITASGLWRDDAQVAMVGARKMYTERAPGVLVRVSDELDDQLAGRAF